MPTFEELDAIKLIDGKARACAGGEWTPDSTCDCDEPHTFEDGRSSVICTWHATQIMNRYPSECVVCGFQVDDNPVTHREIDACGGHDFAVVSDRYIVDHWLRDVVGEKQMVFDLENPKDAPLILERYGDRTKWE